MKIKKTDIKNIIIACTFFSCVLLFFSYFTISVPMLDTFLESSSFSVSFFSLPNLIQDNALGLITRLAGKASAVTALLLSGLLKYICLVSSLLGFYGIWAFCRDRKNTKFITASQIIALSMNVISFLIIIIANVFIGKYSSDVARLLKLGENLEFHFLPTLWLCIAALASAASIVFVGIWHKSKQKEV